MTWTEMKKKIDTVREEIEALLKKRFPVKFVGPLGNVYMKNDKGIGFCVRIVRFDDPFLVIEYDDTWEDGDQFYPTDYESIEAMLADMLREIEDT